MNHKTYLKERSVTAHQSMISAFVRAMKDQWGSADIHVSSDSAIAGGVGESRLEIPAMISWDSFIGARQIQELVIRPDSRHYHRYLPFPESVQQSLDEWAMQKLKISLHHQLLTGVVIYVDPREFKGSELDELECSAVGKRIALLAPGHYWREKFEVTRIGARDNRDLVNQVFERIWEAKKRSRVMRLHYSYPETFSTDRYVPEGVRKFIAYSQKGRCPCQDACDLNRSNDWEVDHIVPIHSGGTNVLINLQATCKAYNRRKKERPEPRTFSYRNVMNDPRWKPQVTQAHEILLLNQQSSDDQLRRIQRLFNREARTAFA